MGAFCLMLHVAAVAGGSDTLLPATKPLVPWWSKSECVRLTSSPPPAIAALRKLHAAPAGTSAPRCAVGLMRGGVNNVRQANYMATVLAVLTGRSLSACSTKNDIGYRFDRRTLAASVGMRNEKCCGEKWTEVAGLGGDVAATSCLLRICDGAIRARHGTNGVVDGVTRLYAAAVQLTQAAEAAAATGDASSPRPDCDAIVQVRSSFLLFALL